MPTNSRKRAARVQAWNESWAAGCTFNPRRATGRDARYQWIQAVMRSDLASTTRLVAHTLASHGTSSGDRIFPSVRTLSKETALSERAVCEHVDRLVRRGYLGRQSRGGNLAGARGFAYLLFLPSVLTEGQHQKPAVAGDDQEGGDDSVLTQDQHSADPDAAGADGRSVSVLTHGQRSYP